MNKTINIFAIFFVLLVSASCGVKDYLRDPDSDVLIETIHSATLTGYVINVAMAEMNGTSIPHVSFTRTGNGYPCTSYMVVNLSQQEGYSYTTEKADMVTVAGLWADSTTAIFSILYTNYRYNDRTLDLVGIQTVPVIKEGNITHVAMATQDIQLNPDQDAILSLNLNTMEIESEYLRLDMTRANDVYVAVTQNAYLIDIQNNATVGNLNDDEYTITGGGQLVEIAGNSAEIVQLAMVEVRIAPECNATPVSGMSLIRVTGVKSKGFPELGTALLEFNDDCDGKADVFVATGMYVASNGSSISFLL